MSVLLTDPAVVIPILIILVLAGTVKGTFGIGMPAVAMSLLPFVIEPALAVTILALPIIATNVQQVVTAKNWMRTVARFVPAMLSLFVTTFLASLFLKSVSADFITFIVGITLILFAVFALFKFELPVSESTAWQLVVGVSAGIVGGFAAVKTPIMIYGSALKLPKEEFIVVTGCMFLTGGLGMAAGLTTSSLLNWETLPLAVLALVAAIIGFQIGAQLRKRIHGDLFRKIILYILLFIGVRLVLTSVF